MKDKTKAFDIALGIALGGGFVTGILSLILAALPFFGGDFIPAGILLIAAALSFGLIAIAINKS
jgi:hypothetical protein